ESIFGDKYADETSWNFDDQDTESVWGSNAMNNESDHHGSAHNSFFGSDDFGVNPVRVGSPSGASTYGKKKSSFFDDSVPSS
ncbi:hypothetical protein L9G15_26250, partial [Shewanella sp. A3A]|nr:hypothetical protein [Shewanella ferrihydritica]